MIEKKIAIGIIGTGAHASENIFPTLYLHPNFDIIAISSRSSERASNYSKKYQIPFFTNDWKKLANLNNLEAIFVAATPQFHTEVVSYFLEKGIHIFLEKPPASNISELNKIVELEKIQSNAVVFIDFNFRFAKAISLVNEIFNFQSDLKYARIKFVTSKPREKIWGLKTVQDSILYAVGIHAIEMPHAWFGLPCKIKSSIAKIKNDCCAISTTLEFSGGRMASLELGNYANKFESKYELVFAEGSVVTIDDQTNIKIYGLDSIDNKILSSKSNLEFNLPSSRGGYQQAGYEQIFSEFARTIHLGTESQCSLKHCLNVYKTMENISNEI